VKKEANKKYGMYKGVKDKLVETALDKSLAWMY
jgi:hypothetical protein